MARDCHGYGVSGAGSGYGSCCSRHADLSCQGAVGTRLPPGNLLQGFPDLALKGGGADVKRKGGIGFMALNQAG